MATVTISKEAAEQIYRAFLPLNENKLRKPHMAPEELEQLRSAVREFKTALAKAA